MSWQKQAKLENDALIIPTQYDVNLVRNVTNHWMCHNRAHPGYIVIDHMAHQLLNHLCQK